VRADRLLSSSAGPKCEAAVNQSSIGDFAIRQGPWKLIFHSDGMREVFNLAGDLGETKIVARSHGWRQRPEGE
jgi:hypothetical protein